MNREFTVDEIKDAAKMARIHCPGFSEEKFESLMELEQYIADSGYLEAVQGLIRLEEEKGTSCTEAINACEDLLEQKNNLEREVADLEKRLESLVMQIKQTIGEYEQIKKAITKAGHELVQIRNEHAATEKKLETFNETMEKEKLRISKDVEACYQQANVTKEGVMTAGRIKAEMESHGFSLELVLDLSKEFAGYENARNDLADGLKEYGSLKKYLDNFAERSNKEKTRVTAEIAGLESQERGLISETGRLRNVLSQMQADITNEEELRRVYSRYWGVSSLIEHLASWNQVFFMRCDNPVYALTGTFDSNSGNAHFWTDKPPTMCPHCGYRHLLYDEIIYRMLNWPIGTPIKLNLGK